MQIEKEQLRADLLRSISHDLRTPLTSISGNASNLLSNENEFSQETRMQIVWDIYDDSMVAESAWWKSAVCHTD